MAPQYNISDSIYNAFTAFLQKQCGIVLGHNKQYLVRSRLLPIVKKTQFSHINELVEHVLQRHDPALMAIVIEAMTTNETFWFRDAYPFSILKDIIFPQFQKQKQLFRIWCAACSSGQEPYSVSISALEFEKASGVTLPLEIIGTDISQHMIHRSKSASYDSLSLTRGLSDTRRAQFFSSSGDNGQMKLNEEVTRRVSFKVFNLLDTYDDMGKFDIVFCRNVLIYFSPELKKYILQQIAARLNKGGVLFLGASESITGLSDEFEFVRCPQGLYYQKAH